MEKRRNEFVLPHSQNESGLYKKWKMKVLNNYATSLSADMMQDTAFTKLLSITVKCVVLLNVLIPHQRAALTGTYNQELHQK